MYGGSEETTEGEGKGEKGKMLRENMIRRLLLYLQIWIALFILLCIISIVKNWSILVAAIGGIVTSIISIVVMLFLVIYIIMMLFGIRR